MSNIIAKYFINNKNNACDGYPNNQGNIGSLKPFIKSTPSYSQPNVIDDYQDDKGNKNIPVIFFNDLPHKGIKPFIMKIISQPFKGNIVDKPSRISAHYLLSFKTLLIVLLTVLGGINQAFAQSSSLLIDQMLSADSSAQLLALLIASPFLICFLIYLYKSPIMAFNFILNRWKGSSK